jgi:hypothetical protein
VRRIASPQTVCPFQLAFEAPVAVRLGLAEVVTLSEAVISHSGTPEEEPERDDALPWEFTNTSMQEFQEEVKSLVLKLSLVSASHCERAVVVF